MCTRTLIGAALTAIKRLDPEKNWRSRWRHKRIGTARRPQPSETALLRPASPQA
ncbi:hypothetical protein Z945_2662 [Sulfitobacter noctilucae]|nr:hypothetical protein Z945_2662 [Sulfitobacter noctilucae]